MKTLFESKRSETRDILDGRIGEIITAIIGDNTLQEIFEKPEYNEQFIEENAKGKPSAFIAMDLGIIDQDTKTALLVAQAAERTVRRVEAAQELASGRATGVDQGLAIADNDEVFKFVGSDRDPQELKEAQGSWQISQVLMNKAKTGAARNDIAASHNAYKAMEGFQKIAADQCAQSAATLKDKGFDDGAEKLTALADELRALPLGSGQTPHQAISNLTPENDDQKALFDKLADITSGQKASAPAPKQVQAAQARKAQP